MALWKRREPAPDGAASRAVFGVGMQVVVRLDRTRYPESMVDDPIGVIVGAGDSDGAALYAPVSGRDAIWTVQFDEPFYGLDGSGPHLSARVVQASLEPAPEA